MSAAQSMAALQLANEQRAKVANIKRMLRTQRPKQEGLRLLAAMLTHTDSAPLGSMRVEDAIKACFHVGDYNARHILRLADLRHGRIRIRDLSPGRRQQLAGALLEWAAVSQAVAA